MKRVILLIIAFNCLSGVSFAQENRPNSVQEIISQHLMELKKLITDYDNIFVATTIDEQLSLPEKVLKIENGINARLIKKRDKNYLVVVRIASQSDYIKIDMINYSVIKLSNKEVQLINLNNGKTYVIKK
jgi:hypothetical protein